MIFRSNFFYLTAISIVLLMFFPGCKEGSSSKENFVSGTIDLADGSSLENMIRALVSIDDISTADMENIKVREVVISPIEELPIKFSIAYNVSEINLSHSYSIRAEIIELNENGVEERVYLTTQTYPVITGGFGDSVNVLVERVD